jgi:hypothetical protein
LLRHPGVDALAGHCGRQADPAMQVGVDTRHELPREGLLRLLATRFAECQVVLTESRNAWSNSGTLAPWKVITSRC